jgi:hypothetical protein
VPVSQLSVGVISVGYPALAPGMGPSPPIMGSPARRPRKPSSESIHRGTWS